MESKHRFPQSLENACAFPTFPPPRLRLPSPHKKGKIVDREREKYLTMINKVFPFVLKRHPDATLVVAGMNPPQELRNRASEHVRVTGFVEDMGAEIACSSLYVSPMVSGS